MLEFAASRRILLAGRRPILGLGMASLGEWLIGLRWVAIVGMMATTLIARRLVPGIAIGPIHVVLGITASLNVVWLYLVQGRRPAQLADLPRTYMVGAQLALDVILLGGVLWFSGGVENPFAIFLTFQVALAALLLGGAAAICVALLAVAVAAALAAAPPLPWQTALVPIAPLQHAGRVAALGGVATFVGVTAYLYRRRLESLRTESARNERFVVLGRLMGGMAHELNTPLATIVVASDELVEVGRAAGDAEIERLASTVSQEAKRASNVIGLLRGQLREIRMAEPVDVSRVIVDAIEAEVRALGWGGGVVVDVPPGLIAWAIPTALRQILSNVVKNATEALEGRSGGVVTARARRDGQRVVVAIEDNGCGIDGVDLPHIGEPFLTTKAARGGTGLGLYVSSLLAEQMGAVLQIEPLVGRSGTRVTLTLRDRDARPPHGGREVSSEPEPDDGDGAPIRDSHA